MKLIDADALLEGIAELKQSPWFNNKYGYADRKEAVEIVEDLCIKNEPTIEERKKGRIVNPTPYGECSECGCLIDSRDGYNFCPNCGAKMERKEE